MIVRANFNNQEYNLIYNPQSGYYEIELQTPETGGIFETKITATDILENQKESNIKIQILAKEKVETAKEGTLVFILDKDTLEVKDIIEYETYNYIIDEETNKNTIFEVMKKINAENDDKVILKREDNMEYYGIVKDVTNENGELKRQVTVQYISNIFDRDIILEDEEIISQTGIEDFIKATIESNFTESDDEFLNYDWLDVEVETHTKITKSVDNQNGIYNFHTFITNCTQNYNIVLDFKYVDGRIKLTIFKQEQLPILIDATTPDISNYIEKFETSVVAKVVVKTDADVQTWYLLSDRTTTQNKNDPNRARGKVETIYTSKSEDAEQSAYNRFKSNTYNHYISFNINRNSMLFDVPSMKIGTPLSVRTNNNIILDTYISAIEDDGSNFLKITCGNMRIEFLDKYLKERKK